MRMPARWQKYSVTNGSSRRCRRSRNRCSPGRALAQATSACTSARREVGVGQQVEGRAGQERDGVEAALRIPGGLLQHRRGGEGGGGDHQRMAIRRRLRHRRRADRRRRRRRGSRPRRAGRAGSAGARRAAGPRRRSTRPAGRARRCAPGGSARTPWARAMAGAASAAASRAATGDHAAGLLGDHGLRRMPMPLISTSTTSPGTIQGGGLRACATPSGVPVAMTSPGESGVKAEI